jgi:cell division protein FtsW
MIIVITGLGMYFLAGARWKHILIIFAGGLIAATALVAMRPYLLDRVDTFLHPSRDPKGASWQIQQSMLAIGSGEIFGRGYGQSIQKFRYLPEPAGDSIFAVLGEEFGFIGTVALIIAYLALLFRGLKISRTTTDQFGGLVVAGIVILLVSQSFLNIASSTGLFPLSGTPLIFISHGGTALLTALAAVGIVLNISKNERYITKT